MKKNITKEEEKALLEITKRLLAAVDSRGDLEARDNDSEDFINFEDVIFCDPAI